MFSYILERTKNVGRDERMSVAVEIARLSWLVVNESSWLLFIREPKHILEVRNSVCPAPHASSRHRTDFGLYLAGV